MVDLYLSSPFRRLMTAGAIDLVGVSALVATASSGPSSFRTGCCIAITLTGLGAYLSWPLLTQSCKDRPPL